jgi:hypothetical protein
MQNIQGIDGVGAVLPAECCLYGCFAVCAKRWFLPKDATSGFFIFGKQIEAGIVHNVLQPISFFLKTRFSQQLGLFYEVKSAN